MVPDTVTVVSLAMLFFTTLPAPPTLVLSLAATLKPIATFKLSLLEIALTITSCASIVALLIAALVSESLFTMDTAPPTAAATPVPALTWPATETKLDLLSASTDMLVAVIAVPSIRALVSFWIVWDTSEPAIVKVLPEAAAIPVATPIIFVSAIASTFKLELSKEPPETLEIKSLLTLLITTPAPPVPE